MTTIQPILMGLVPVPSGIKYFNSRSSESRSKKKKNGFASVGVGEQLRSRWLWKWKSFYHSSTWDRQKTAINVCYRQVGCELNSHFPKTFSTAELCKRETLTPRIITEKLQQTISDSQINLILKTKAWFWRVRRTEILEQKLAEIPQITTILCMDG